MTPSSSATTALLGDVVAFTALPAVWVGRPPAEIARALADALDRTLHPGAVAVLMREEVDRLVEARAGEAPLLDASVEAWRAGRPVDGSATCVAIGPLGARGAILLHAGDVEPERMLLVRLAANLADTALREAALHHQAAASRERLTRLEKLSALGQLVSGVAHELRTPLTYANNHLYLAQMALSRATTVEPAERARLEARLAEVLEAHERIGATIGMLRRFTVPSEKAQAEVALAEVAREAVKLFVTTQAGSVRVETMLEGTTIVRANALQLQQVALNLLQNAADATPHGGRVLVATSDTPRGPSLVVEDDGPGVPLELRGRIFEPFYTTKGSGTGLGLSIVRGIAEAHGASIHVGSSPSGGARFEVVFPPTAGTGTVVPVDVGAPAALSRFTSS